MLWCVQYCLTPSLTCAPNGTIQTVAEHLLYDAPTLLQKKRPFRSLARVVGKKNYFCGINSYFDGILKGPAGQIRLRVVPSDSPILGSDIPRYRFWFFIWSWFFKTSPKFWCSSRSNLHTVITDERLASFIVTQTLIWIVKMRELQLILFRDRLCALPKP